MKFKYSEFESLWFYCNCKEDHQRLRHNLCICEKKAQKKNRLAGIHILAREIKGFLITAYYKL